MASSTASAYEFEDFRIDPLKRLLLRGGPSVALPPKAFDLLLLLIQARPRALKKDELMKAIWPDTFVEEGNLTQNIFLLRRALGESPHDHRFIITLPGQGYRFVAETRPAAPAKAAAPLGAIASVAVLPFRVLDPDAGGEYLEVGMADALTSKLGGIQALTVRSAGSNRRSRGSRWDPLRDGRELNVDVVVYGTIQRSGGRIRIAAQILNVRDGSVLWADKFEESFTAIFTIQDDISEQVAQALAGKLTGDEKRRLTRRHTDNAKAYQSYLKGRFFWNKRTPEGFTKAIEWFEQAAATDPTYALAYAGLADCYNLLAGYSIVRPRDAWPKASESAIRALEIDDRLAEAHASLALVLMCYDWDWPEAERQCRQAIELSPQYSTAHENYAEYLIAMGRDEEAIAEINKARELDPTSLIINRDVGCILYYARHYDEAIDQLRDTLDMDPNFALARWSLGRAYAQKGLHQAAITEFQAAIKLSGTSAQALASLGYAHGVTGNRTEARRVLEELNQVSRERYISPHEMALVWTGLGQTGRALECLKEACEHREWAIVDIDAEPMLDPLRSDPRFEALRQRARLQTAPR